MNNIKLTAIESHDSQHEQAKKIAELIGGTLLIVNVTDHEALIAGGDLSKLDI